MATTPELTDYERRLLTDMLTARLNADLVKHLHTEARTAFDHLLDMKLIDALWGPMGKNYSATDAGRRAIQGTPPAGVKVLEDMEADAPLADDVLVSRMLGVDGLIHLVQEDGTAICGFTHFAPFGNKLGHMPCRGCHTHLPG